MNGKQKAKVLSRIKMLLVATFAITVLLQPIEILGDQRVPVGAVSPVVLHNNGSETTPINNKVPTSGPVNKINPSGTTTPALLVPSGGVPVMVSTHGMRSAEDNNGPLLQKASAAATSAKAARAAAETATSNITANIAATKAPVASRTTRTTTSSQSTTTTSTPELTPTSEPIATSTPEPIATSTPEATPTPTVPSAPKSDPIPTPQSVPTPAAPTPEPVPIPTPAPEPRPVLPPAPEPVPVPTPAPEPTLKPRPVCHAACGCDANGMPIPCKKGKGNNLEDKH